MLDLALVALVVVPAAVGSGLLLAGPLADRPAAAVGTVTAALVALLAVATAFPPGGSRPSVSTPFMAGSDLALAVDGLAAPVLPTVAVVAALVLLVSTGSGELRTARFHGLMLLFVAAVVATVLAPTLPTLLLSWEVMGATSFALIGYRRDDPAAVASGTTAFVTTRAADLGLYLAAGAALAGGAGMELSAWPEATDGWRHVVAAGVLVAGLGKAAQVPFSFWLSRAMHGPSPVSALLHSAAMVAMGGYLLLRVSPTLAATGWADDAAAWVGAVTAVGLGLVALAQSDLKQLLAASTAAQLGYVVLAAGLGATAAGSSHLVAHAAVKAGLFLAAGLWLTALGTTRLSALGGAARTWPVVGACAAAALVSLAGLPPFALWATKDAVLAGALERSPLLYLTGLAGAALAAGYAARALSMVLGLARDDEPAAPGDGRVRPRGIPRTSQVGLVPLATGAVVLGALALPPLGPAVHDLVGGVASEPGPAEVLLSTLVVAAVFVATVVVARRGSLVRRVGWPAPLVDWLFLERAAHALVARPVVRLAEVSARLDDTVLDRGVEAGARWTVGLARLSTRVDDTLVDAGVRRLATGTRRVGRAAQRPQTGQLHQYYLQALAVLGMTVLVLVVVR